MTSAKARRKTTTSSTEDARRWSWRGAPRIPRRSLVALAALLVVVCAHAPVLQAGLLAPDYGALLGNGLLGREVTDGVTSFVPPWAQASFLAGSLPPSGGTARLLRFENLGLLLVLALCAGATLRRLLGPWTGATHARAAGWVCALFLALHPLAPGVVASLAARGELLGLALGLGAAVLFLSGRQEQRDGLVVASLALLVLAAFSSRVTLILAGGLALAEFSCTHRHRRRSRRLRTTLTTALAFGLAALLPVGLARAAPTPAEPLLSAAESLRQESVVASEHLGRLFVPVRSATLGMGGVLVAGALLLLALQPAFRATRNAPRLWGGLGLAWAGALAAALIWWGSETDGVAGGKELLAVLVMSAGLAVTVTALSARRRMVSGTLVALGLCGLAHANARPWLAASAVVSELRDDLSALALGSGTRVFVLDLPHDVQGLDPFGEDLGWLLHPALLGDSGGADFDPQRMRGLTSAAFLALVRQPEFAELRGAGLTVLAPDPVGSGARAAHAFAPLPATPTRLPKWSSALRYDLEPELDPLLPEAVRIRAEISTPAVELERLAWRNRANQVGSCAGIVGEEQGEHVALFDLGRSLDWILCGGVRRVTVERSKGQSIVSGEFLATLPEPRAVQPPRVEGSDWLCAPLELGLALPAGAGRWVLSELALADYAYREFALEPSAEGELCARGAQRFAALHARPGAPIAWSLDYRIGELAVARTRGRSP